MNTLMALMVLLYATQAACINPGLAFLPLASYLSDSLGFSAAQLAGFQATVMLPWFTKPLWGILTDGFPLWGYRVKSYLALCGVVIVASFIGLGCWPQPSASVLMVGILMVSTGVACADVLADRLMVIEGRTQAGINRLQAAQWTGLGFTAIAMYGLGGWLADGASLSWAFFLSALLPLLSLGWVLRHLPEKANYTITVKQNWQRFWQALQQPGLRQTLVWVVLIQVSPLPVDYLYQREVLAFDNTLIGQLKALEYLGLGLGAGAFGWGARQWRLPLLPLAIIGSAIATLSLAFMRDATSAYGVYGIRGLAQAVGMLSLLGLIAARCPPGAEGFTYALMVSVSNLAMGIGLVMGGQLYDWGLSFAGVAAMGAGYLALLGGAISLYTRVANVDRG